jgi:hypothetical protein
MESYFRSGRTDGMTIKSLQPEGFTQAGASVASSVSVRPSVISNNHAKRGQGGVRPKTQGGKFASGIEGWHGGCYSGQKQGSGGDSGG